MNGVKRQTLVRPNYPCDLYSGEDLSSHIAQLLKRLNPLKCKVILVHDETCDTYLFERLSRFIVDADYTLIDVEPSKLGNSMLSISAFSNLVELLEENHCTADDIIVAVGGSDLLSLANYTVRTFRKGIGYVAYPLDCIAAYSVSVAPASLYVGDQQCLSSEPCSDQVLLDWSYLDQDRANHTYLLSLLFKGSLAAGDDLYRWLYEFAEQLTEDVKPDSDEYDTVRLWRNALLMGLHEFASVKNIGWGEQIHSAFEGMLDGADAQTITYETVAFATRLAAAHEKADVAFIQELDGFMDKLGFKKYTGALFSGDELHDAMRKSFFASHNRMLLQVPVSVGVVQPILVQDEILKAHCNAWVKSHRS